MLHDPIVSASMAAKDNLVTGFSGEVQQIYDHARENEPAITRDMVSIAVKAGCVLFGLQNSVKTGSHVAEKIHGKMERYPDMSPVAIITAVGDLIRYTEVAPHDRIPDAADTTLSELAHLGYTVVEVDNKFMEPHPVTGYRGLHINAVSPSGQEFEIQIHSPVTLEAKENCHDLDSLVLCKERVFSDRELIRKTQEVFGTFPNPDGIERISSFFIHFDESGYAANRIEREYDRHGVASRTCITYDRNGDVVDYMRYQAEGAHFFDFELNGLERETSASTSECSAG